MSFKGNTDNPNLDLGMLISPTLIQCPFSLDHYLKSNKKIKMLSSNVGLSHSLSIIHPWKSKNHMYQIEVHDFIAFNPNPLNLV